MPGVMPVALSRFNPMVLSPVPVFTVIVRVFVLRPVIVPTLAPLIVPAVVNEKLLADIAVTGAPKVAVYCTVAAFVGLEETAVMEFMVVEGAAEPTTLNVADAPGAGVKFPARSLAVPAAIEMPNVPAPVMFEIVTV